MSEYDCLCDPMNAIEFALDECALFDELVFLRAWREGDFWPDYAAWVGKKLEAAS